MYRGLDLLRPARRRRCTPSAASTSPSGTSRARRSGKPVCELLGDAAARPRPRLRLHPDARHASARSRERVEALRRAGLHRRSSSAGGRSAATPSSTSRSCSAAARRGGDEVDLLIDAGLGYGADADHAIRVVRGFEELGVLLARGAVRAGRVRGLRRARRHGRHPRCRRRGGRDPLGLPRADRARPRRRRPARRHPLRRHHPSAAHRPARARCAASRCVPHAWKSGIIKAASLHVNAVLPDALFQEYCVAETPINTLLTRERLPIDADGLLDGAHRPGARGRARHGRARALPGRVSVGRSWPATPARTGRRSSPRRVARRRTMGVGVGEHPPNGG